MCAQNMRTVASNGSHQRNSRLRSDLLNAGVGPVQVVHLFANTVLERTYIARLLPAV